MITKEKELGYRTVPDGAYYYGVTVVTGGVHRLMMWSDCLGAEGTDREIKIDFRLYEVTVRGSGLLALLRDAKRHKIDILIAAPRSQAMMGGEGMVITDIEVKRVEP